jgi:hypothetical protein
MNGRPTTLARQRAGISLALGWFLAARVEFARGTVSQARYSAVLAAVMRSGI